MDKIVIVGASAAGISAADALRQRGFTGRITLLGSESHLPYDRPPLSKQLLSGQWEPERLRLRSAEQLTELDLNLRLGATATGLDPHRREIVLAEGEPVDYDGLIIATGAAPRRLPGGDLAGVHYLRTLDDALALRSRMRPESRMVVIGAGFIGAEAAAVARDIGLPVTMVDPAAAPMLRAFGKSVAELLAALHVDRGVDLRCGTGASSLISERGAVTGVVLDTGERIPADVVVVGIGAIPNTGWLAGSGLLSDGRLDCDEYCAVASGVYAAGDVASWFNPLFGTRMRVEHRTSAAEHARAAATNLLAAPADRRPFASVPYFWTDQYDLKVQAWGHFDESCDLAVRHGDLSERKFVAVYGRDGRVVGAVGAGMPKQLREARSLIVEKAEFPG
ncbi:FAD-dependent oxidoreductase [Nonomuraea sp. B10E15]|uniref:NAD(P)/FAD-dependent oxidoreductase n=1 Tax=Nonomuraea sp. B10E15 TaxID=3153560 RepID=UPI00325CD24C